MIKVFSQENCPNCEELKSYLKSANIDFEELDVNKDFKAKAAMLMNDIESTPAVDINGSMFGGSIEELESEISVLY